MFNRIFAGAYGVLMTAIEPPFKLVQRLIGAHRMPYLFLVPTILLFAAFVYLPIGLNLQYSVTGGSSLLLHNRPFVGGAQFGTLFDCSDFTSPASCRDDLFWTAVWNTARFFLFDVVLIVGVSLFTALILNKSFRGRGFFRTAFYFPSVTSTVAITVLWLFLFSASGVVNEVLSWIGINGPNWFSDPSGIIHNGLATIGVTEGPAVLTDNSFLGLSWWQWLAGPSVAMTALIFMAVFTTSGTFMLLFIAALQNLGGEIHEVRQPFFVLIDDPFRRFAQGGIRRIKQWAYFGQFQLAAGHLVEGQKRRPPHGRAIVGQRCSRWFSDSDLKSSVDERMFECPVGNIGRSGQQRGGRARRSNTAKRLGGGPPIGKRISTQKIEQLDFRRTILPDAN